MFSPQSWLKFVMLDFSKNLYALYYGIDGVVYYLIPGFLESMAIYIWASCVCFIRETLSSHFKHACSCQAVIPSVYPNKLMVCLSSCLGKNRVNDIRIAQTREHMECQVHWSMCMHACNTIDQWRAYCSVSVPFSCGIDSVSFSLVLSISLSCAVWCAGES
mgnify:CR=1 FL=1